MKKYSLLKLSLVSSVALAIAGNVLAEGMPKSLQSDYKAIRKNLSPNEVNKYAPITSYSQESGVATNYPTYDDIKYNPNALAPTMPVGGLEVNKSTAPNTKSERTYFLDERGRPVYDPVPQNLIRKNQIKPIKPADIAPRSKAPEKVWTPASKVIEEVNIPKLKTPENQGITILTPEELEKIPESKTEAKKKSETKSGKKSKTSDIWNKWLSNYSEKLASNYNNSLDNIPTFEVASSDESFVVAQVYNYNEANDPLIKAAQNAGALKKTAPVQTQPVKPVQQNSNIPTFLKNPVTTNQVNQTNAVQWRSANPQPQRLQQQPKTQSPIVVENMKTLSNSNNAANITITQPQNLAQAKEQMPLVKRPANKFIPAEQAQKQIPPKINPQTDISPSAVTKPQIQASFMNTGAANSGYTMEQFLAQAYSKNPELTALREAIKAADEGMPQALSGFLPRLDINLNNSFTRSGTGTSNKENFFPSSQSLEVNQSIFGGGETYYQVLAAKDRIYSARYELKSEEQNFLRQAIESYVNLIFTRKVFTLSQKNESSLTENLTSTRQRFAIGDTTRTDVAQSEARLANAVSNRVSAENDYINAKSTFRKIFLSEAPENLTMPTNLPPLPKTLDEALSISIRNNPEVQRNLFAKNQRENEIGVQRSQLLPQVDLTGSVSKRESVTGTTLFNNEQEVVGVNVRVPLYDSGISFSRTREAKDRKNQSENEYQSSILNTRDRVVQAWQALASASLNIEATKAALLAAEYALDGVKEEQREGQRAIFEILDAQREMFNAEISHARAIRDSVLAMYNLKAAVGQLSPSDLNLPVKDYDPEEHYNNTKFKFIGF